MTPPEVVLWSHLRRKQLAGLRFRRQRPLGPYIADFYCHEARLVVEVDSSFHSGDNHARDVERDRWMKSRGLRVLRVTAGEIAKDLEGVLRTIRRAAESHGERPPPPRRLGTSPASAGEDAESDASR